MNRPRRAQPFDALGGARAGAGAPVHAAAAIRHRWSLAGRAVSRASAASRCSAGVTRWVAVAQPAHAAPGVHGVLSRGHVSPLPLPSSTRTGAGVTSSVSDTPGDSMSAGGDGGGGG